VFCRAAGVHQGQVTMGMQSTMCKAIRLSTFGSWLTLYTIRPASYLSSSNKSSSRATVLEYR